jgi:ribonuclease BN (tRNA processing enzyme)
MRVYFWGTRGSIPASFSTNKLRPKLREILELSQGKNLDSEDAIDKFIDELPFALKGTYGTNTSCVEIRGGDEYVLCDCGSGLRDFSSYVWDLHHTKPQVFNIFMSHLHWDHITGFPFFVPAYIRGNKINIYSPHETAEAAFRRQQDVPSFPVPMNYMSSEIKFHTLDVNKAYDIAGFKVKVIQQNHPGVAYGYSFEKDGQKAVYSTDSEHTVESNKEGYPFIEFFKDADVLIFDAQYELFDAIDTKANWGHSSNVIGVELAVRSKVKRLCLFHNEHTADDEVLTRFLQETKNYLHIFKEDYPMEVHLSYDGLEIDCANPISIDKTEE